MNSVYTYDSLDRLPIKQRYVFVFCEERDISKLGTAPNISMQLGYFDDDLPIVFILTEPELVTIYERILPSNSFLVLLDKKILKNIKSSAWEYVFAHCMEHGILYALFAEWYSVLSMKTGDTIIPINMDKNPCFDWEDKDAPHIDFSGWMDNMIVTLEQNDLSALGVDRRHSEDLLWLADSTNALAHNVPYPPIQLVAYNFTKLRQLNCPKWLNTHTQNYFIRDTIVAMLITSLGGEVNTISSFTVNAPSVVYTEEDLHTILNLGRRFPSLLRKKDA